MGGFGGRRCFPQKMRPTVPEVGFRALPPEADLWHTPPLSVEEHLRPPARVPSATSRHRRAGARAARRGRRRAAGSGQDHARATGALRRRPGAPAAAAPRRGPGDRSPHRRRARLDRGPRGRVARAVRTPQLSRYAPARRHRGHPHRPAAARPAPLGLSTVVIDEFHERSMHADVGLALARQAWQARSDLRLVVMSATHRRVARGGLPRQLPGRQRARTPFPMHDPLSCPASVWSRRSIDVRAAYTAAPCCASCRVRREIRRAAVQPGRAPRLCRRADPPAARRIGRRRAGRRDPAFQRPPGHPRHEHRRDDADRARRDVRRRHRPSEGRPVRSRAIDRQPGDGARIAGLRRSAGGPRRRALRPGAVVRLWDERDRLRPHREPEIARVDLAGPALDVLAWGDDPRDVRVVRARRGPIGWRPRSGCSVGSARSMRPGASRRRVGTFSGCRSTHVSAACFWRRVALPQVARACALLSERHFAPAAHGTDELRPAGGRGQSAGAARRTSSVRPTASARRPQARSAGACRPASTTRRSDERCWRDIQTEWPGAAACAATGS